MISTKPPAGMRDFLPEDLERRRFVLRTIETTYRRHDFQPLETPVLERLQILTGKYGAEGDQLMFKVLKRGDKLAAALENDPGVHDLADFGMRYDLTVPLCRVVAQYQSKLPRIFKCFQMRPVWRADRPARGRFREFYQCDVDIAGTTSVLAEVDVISAAAEALLGLGFEDFEIRVNDRVLLNAVATHAGIPHEQQQKALVALDKLDKIGEAGVRAEMIGAGIADTATDALFDLLGAATPVQDDEADPQLGLAALRAALGGTEPRDRTDEALNRLDKVFDLSKAVRSTAGHITFDPTLARGLTYYTGPIFEITLPGFAGSVGGGGRYDDLVGMFLGRQVPACGISLGVERLLMIMDERGMFSDELGGVDVFVTQFPRVSPKVGVTLAANLRQAGIVVAVHPESTKLKKQFALAQKSGARIVAVIGPDEAEAESVALKRMATGDQVTVPIDDAIDRVREWLAGA